MALGSLVIQLRKRIKNQIRIDEIKDNIAVNKKSELTPFTYIPVMMPNDLPSANINTVMDDVKSQIETYLSNSESQDKIPKEKQILIDSILRNQKNLN